MTSAERLALRFLAANATPGRWTIEPGNFIAVDGLIVAEVPCTGANDADVPYIAACSPQNIIALLDHIDTLI